MMKREPLVAIWEAQAFTTTVILLSTENYQNNAYYIYTNIFQGPFSLLVSYIREATEQWGSYRETKQTQQ
jgi:hypothetical protein